MACLVALLGLLPEAAVEQSHGPHSNAHQHSDIVVLSDFKYGGGCGDLLESGVQVVARPARELRALPEPVAAARQTLLGVARTLVAHLIRESL